MTTTARPGARPGAHIITGGGDRIECHYVYYPSTPDRNMSGRVEDAEQGRPSEIDALNIFAVNEDDAWTAIDSLLEDLPGFDSGKLMEYLREKEDAE